MPVSNERRRELYKANPDAQKERNKRYLLKKGKPENPDEEKEKIKLRVRQYRLKHKYKMTQEEWDNMFVLQGNVCAICKRDNPGTKHHWHTDHCHETGVVRGILCHPCNSYLVRRGATPNILRAAADYLER